MERLVKKCPSCGYSNRDDAAFCASCGLPLPSAAAPPAVKPVPSVRVVTPVAPAAPARVPAPGMCYYHPHLPAVNICSRCGRSVCRYDSIPYDNLILCPPCYQTIAQIVPAPMAPIGPVPAAPPAIGAVPPAPAPGYTVVAPVVPPARALWGFILSIIAGIMVLINAAGLTSAWLYVTLASIFPWIGTIAPFPPWMLIGIGVILGIIMIIGSLLMIMGYGTIGSIVVFVPAIISLIMGGGFVAGFILGIVGGIMAMLGR
ncbi:MAG: zinc-ribbon domain-containing protein [Candidatus Bathyarchaeia archaeon]